VSDRRGQISALLASTLLVSAFAGVGVVVALTDAGVLSDANLNSSGNEGDAVAPIHSVAFCPIALSVDPEEFDPGEFDPASVELPPADQPLERVLFPTDPVQATPGSVQWSLTFPGEYYVVVGYGDTLERSAPYAGPGAAGFTAGEGQILAGVSAEDVCGPGGFGVTYDLDTERYDLLLPPDVPVDLDLDDFEDFEEFLQYAETYAR
jgi:hypothetical protein